MFSGLSFIYLFQSVTSSYAFEACFLLSTRSSKAKDILSKVTWVSKMLSKVLNNSLINSWCSLLVRRASSLNSFGENLKNEYEAALVVSSSYYFSNKTNFYAKVALVVFSFCNSSWRATFFTCNSLYLSSDVFTKLII